jgi:hypothetical protein
LTRSGRGLDAFLISGRLSQRCKGKSMFDLLYLVLFAVLFALSVAMIRFFGRI